MEQQQKDLPVKMSEIRFYLEGSLAADSQQKFKKAARRINTALNLTLTMDKGNNTSIKEGVNLINHAGNIIPHVSISLPIWTAAIFNTIDVS